MRWSIVPRGLVVALLVGVFTPLQGQAQPAPVPAAADPLVGYHFETVYGSEGSPEIRRQHSAVVNVPVAMDVDDRAGDDLVGIIRAVDTTSVTLEVVAAPDRMVFLTPAASVQAFVQVGDGRTLAFGYDARDSWAPRIFRATASLVDGGIHAEVESADPSPVPTALTAGLPRSMALIGDAWPENIHARIALEPLPSVVSADIRPLEGGTQIAISSTTPTEARFEARLGTDDDLHQISGRIAQLPTAVEVNLVGDAVRYTASAAIDRLEVQYLHSTCPQCIDRNLAVAVDQLPPGIDLTWTDDSMSVTARDGGRIGGIEVRTSDHAGLIWREGPGFWTESVTTRCAHKLPAHLGGRWMWLPCPEHGGSFKTENGVAFRVGDVSHIAVSTADGLAVDAAVARQPFQIGSLTLDRVHDCSWEWRPSTNFGVCERRDVTGEEPWYHEAAAFLIDVRDLPSGFALRLPSGEYTRIDYQADEEIASLDLSSQRSGGPSMRINVRDLPRRFALCLMQDESEWTFGCTRRDGQGTWTNGGKKIVFSYDDFGSGSGPVAVDMESCATSCDSNDGVITVQNLRMNRLEFEFGDRGCNHDWVFGKPTAHCGHVWFHTDGQPFGGRIDARTDTDLPGEEILEVEFGYGASFVNRYGSWEGGLFDATVTRKEAHGSASCGAGTIFKLVTSNWLFPDWRYHGAFC